MTFYDEMQSLATNLLTEFKQGTIVLVSVTPGSGSIDDPGTPTETPYTLKAAASGPSAKFINAGIAETSDVQIVCAVPSVVPNIKDFVTIDGVRYKIIHVEPKPRAGTPVAYLLIVRR